MTREEAIRELREDKALYETDNCRAGDGSPDGDLLEAIDMAIEALQAEPTKAVPPSLADVYKWERDIALSQLEEYGIGFAEKKRDDLLEVVRCKDCRHRDLFSCPLADNDFQKDDDFCSWGERREGMIKAEWTNKDSLDLQSTCNQLATNLQPTEEDNISRAESVVRCKDCRHYEDGMVGYCWEVERGVSEDFYCAYGERRELGK